MALARRFFLLRRFLLLGFAAVQSTHARVTLTPIALFSLRGTNCQRKVQRNRKKSTFAMINVEEFPQSPLTLPLSFSGLSVKSERGKIEHNGLHFAQFYAENPRQRTQPRCGILRTVNCRIY